MRTCIDCGHKKDDSEFGWVNQRKRGVRYRRRRCQDCYRVQASKNMREWRDNLSTEGFGEYRQKASQRARERNLRLKEAVYEAYGGAICACCGETETLFLSVDHVKNDGYQQRKRGEHGSGARIYNWLWKQHRETGRWPDGFQILCMNCQHGKARNNGVCPHKEVKEGVSTISKESTAKRPEAPSTPPG